MLGYKTIHSLLSTKFSAKVFYEIFIYNVAGCVYDGLEWLLLWPMSRLFG